MKLPGADGDVDDKEEPLPGQQQLLHSDGLSHSLQELIAIESKQYDSTGFIDTDYLEETRTNLDPLPTTTD